MAEFEEELAALNPLRLRKGAVMNAHEVDCGDVRIEHLYFGSSRQPHSHSVTLRPERGAEYEILPAPICEIVARGTPVRTVFRHGPWHCVSHAPAHTRPAALEWLI
jgi:hypothetical protein